MELAITGKVQGVGFRYAAQRKAEELGVLLRQAENTADGGVFIIIEGEETRLQKFVTWAKIGPELAEVRHVRVT